MAAIIDLTWQQLAAQLPANAIVDANNKVVIDVGVVTSMTADALTDTGVIKFFSVLFSAANKAQTTANASQVPGERLAAFNSANIGNAVDGYITLTRPFVCRSELATATNIVGSVA